MNKKNLTKSYTIVAPNGEELEITNLAQFCRDNDLNYNCMMQLQNPERRLQSHKGYKII